ncbi:DUF1349 domain-containing protein, partial [Georgenia sp. 10Sc9-8]|nr:DUF1349 domain-containing protein [Georgenia halotolerans]
MDPCRWEVIDRDDDLLEVSDGAVHVTTADSDFYGTDNSTVPNILRSTQVEGDQWTVQTKFTGALESTYQQGGIIVYGDQDNYVKLDPVYGGGDGPLRVELRSEVGGEVQQPQDDLTSLELAEDQTYHLSLTRDGDTFTGAFSYDGEDWTDLPSAVTNAAVGDAAPGIYALGAQQDAPTTLSFDYFRLVGEEPEPVEVTPVDIEFTDEDGTEDDTYVIPDARGVEYLVDGEVVGAGTYPGTGTVTVTARPLEGYVLADDAQTEWTFDFTDEGTEPEPQPGAQRYGFFLNN